MPVSGYANGRIPYCHSGHLSMKATIMPIGLQKMMEEVVKFGQEK
jgi:hypothetical protein